MNIASLLPAPRRFSTRTAIFSPGLTNSARHFSLLQFQKGGPVEPKPLFFFVSFRHTTMQIITSVGKPERQTTLPNRNLMPKTSLVSGCPIGEQINEESALKATTPR